MPSKKSIAVVGGGILGRLLALELFERGETVTLFEKGNSDGSSSCGFVGLGMISPWSELLHLPQDDAVTLKLGVSSIDKWLFIINKISSPQQNYLNKGCLVISRQSLLIENLKKIISQRSSFESDFKNSHRSEIAGYEPEISKNFPTGLFLPKEGCLDPKILFISLDNYFKKIDLPVFYNCEITIPHSRELKNIDFIIDTRGLGAKKLENNLRGVRGETIRVYAPQVKIDRLVRVVDEKLPLYIVPRGNCVYSLGATCIESEEAKPITVRSMLEILSMARYVHEGFMEAHIMETEVQWRPAYPDNKPKIILNKNFMSINGLYRHGIMCAPALAQMCADLIQKEFSCLTSAENQIAINMINGAT